MNKKLGFIGCGNMAKAIIAGIIETGSLAASEINLYDIDSEKANAIAAVASVNVLNSIEKLCEASDIILLAIKPNVIASLVKANAKHLCGKAIISIAAGITTTQLSQWSEGKARLLRVMPNAPALIGQGATALSLDVTLNQAEKTFAENIFKSIGLALWVPEYLMDAVVGVSGSGPAYAFLFIEAMADGGVNAGLPRDIASKLAAQTLLGAAQMVLESGKHPGELKDMVCSPGGTTSEAIAVLERKAFRSSLIDAVSAATEKSKKLSKENK